MNTITLSDGSCYSVPQSDLNLIRELAAKMKWSIVDKPATDETGNSWVNRFAGKWQDNRSAEQMLDDIHSARTDNSDMSL